MEGALTWTPTHLFVDEETQGRFLIRSSSSYRIGYREVDSLLNGLLPPTVS